MFTGFSAFANRFGADIYLHRQTETHNTNMEQIINILKVDITKLKTVHNYAKDKNLTPAAIYKQAKNDKVKIIIIDGMKFVHI